MALCSARWYLRQSIKTNGNMNLKSEGMNRVSSSAPGPVPDLLGLHIHSVLLHAAFLHCSTKYLVHFASCKLPVDSRALRHASLHAILFCTHPGPGCPLRRCYAGSTGTDDIGVPWCVLPAAASCCRMILKIDQSSSTAEWDTTCMH